MEHTTKRLAGAMLVSALALVWANAAQAQESVKVGFAGPLTGAQAHYGADFKNGITLAVEDFNATKPVIDGKPV